MCFIELKTQSMTCSKKTIVGVVINFMQTLKVENKQCYIMGDFNINLLNHFSHTELQDNLDACMHTSYQ